jgi:hypothetical protein
MAITAISRDQASDANLVRVVSSDTLAACAAADYVSGQAANLSALNNGEWEWLANDTVLLSASDGNGFYVFTAGDFNTFVALASGTGLSSVLASARIFVGSAGNVATGVAMSGDTTISNTGVVAIGAGKVTKAMLAATVRPSHMIVFAGKPTTVGGAAAEAFAVVGAVAATDNAFVQMVDNGTNNVTVLQAVVTNDVLTVTFSGNPGNDAIFNYQIIRATS